MIFPREEQKITSAPQYLIYMWYLENLLRSVNFDMEVIEQQLNAIESISGEQHQEQLANYMQLAADLREEKKEGGGHLEELLDLQDKLEIAHQKLTTTFQDEQYLNALTEARPYIIELKERMQQEDATDLEACLIGVYGSIVLKMGKKDVTPETDEAIKTFKELLKLLSIKYRQILKGELTLNQNLSN